MNFWKGPSIDLEGMLNESTLLIARNIKGLSIYSTPGIVALVKYMSDFRVSN